VRRGSLSAECTADLGCSARSGPGVIGCAGHVLGLGGWGWQEGGVASQEPCGCRLGAEEGSLPGCLAA
jgi:hypothetical protein